MFFSNYLCLIIIVTRSIKRRLDGLNLTERVMNSYVSIKRHLPTEALLLLRPGRPLRRRASVDAPIQMAVEAMPMVQNQNAQDAQIEINGEVEPMPMVQNQNAQAVQIEINGDVEPMQMDENEDDEASEIEINGDVEPMQMDETEDDEASKINIDDDIEPDDNQPVLPVRNRRFSIAAFDANSVNELREQAGHQAERQQVII